MLGSQLLVPGADFIVLTIAETNALYSLCKKLGVKYERSEVYATRSSDGNYYPATNPCLLFPVKCPMCKQVIGWRKVGPMRYEEAMTMLHEMEEQTNNKKQGDLL